MKKFKKLPIHELSELKLTPQIEGEIIRFPNGDLKSNHIQILESIREFASSIKIYSFFYTSNNNKVRAYYLEPKSNSNASLIFFNRSGTGEYGIIEHKTLFTNFFGLEDLLEQGFSLVITQLLGVDGGGGVSDACGQNDLDCIGDLYNILAKYESINPDKIGMIGGSSGGLLTYQSLRKFKWLKTGVIIASPTDEKMSLNERGLELSDYKKNFYDITDLKQLEFRSPIKWVSQIPKNKSIYILHGSADDKVDLHHSLDISYELYENHIPFRMKIYEGGGHSLHEYQADVANEIKRWFQEYLQD
jgi:dipeptidyl aminopeptidase/acylaminoacyl peptidase